jgi:Cft2 family RNA processing exonuclease
MSPGHLLTSFRINDDVLLDAGSSTQSLTLEEQVRIRHVLLTHAHFDHSGTLPFLAENTLGLREEAFLVHSIPESIRSVHEHLFNGVIWPDFSTLPDPDRGPVRWHEMAAGVPVPVGSLTVTAVRVDHAVPAAGYVVDDGRSAVLFTGDTGPTEGIWREASRHPRLKAVFVETSFPDRMRDIAEISGHLTPRTLRAELSKLERDVPKFVYHIKPRFLEETLDELSALGRLDLSVVQQGKVYEF